MVKFLLVILISGGVLGYWWWTTTPQYSLMEAREAIKKHDLASFNKYVDVDSVASKMVDDLLTKPVQQALGPGMVGQLLGFGLAIFVKPPLVATMKQEIADFVEKGSEDKGAGTSFNDSGARPASTGTFKSIPAQLGFTGRLFKGIDYVNTSGKICQIGVALHNKKYNQDLVLEIKMRDMGGYWQIVELSNLQSFMAKIVELQTQHMQQTESRRPLPEPIELRIFPSSA